MDRFLDENEQLKVKSDSILSQLAQINTQKFEKDFNQIKSQSNMVLQNSNILSPGILELKPNLDQLPERLNSIPLHSLLLNKIKNVDIDKQIPRLHTKSVYKIISYENNTKYITCSADKTIIIRNCEDNTIIRTFTNHKKAVRDIFLLSNGRLASASEDNTIKIWNLTNGNCEQRLIGHSDWVYCLLELPNSIILSGSKDSSIGLWDISQQNQKKLQFYHNVKNDKQQQAYCMKLISTNELAVSSHKDINIYSFDNITNKSFHVIKTLKGHTDWVLDFKIMDHNKDLLISCSIDKDCRLWSILQENCLKVFRLHSDKIWSIQILSEKIFVSASTEIIFWNIDNAGVIRFIKPDKLGKKITSLIKNDENELIFAYPDSIGVIKI